jgi:iron complex transport system substrate-binding protein
MRVVSLLPSATEIVCALGRASDLVGRSHECDYPSGLTDRPALTAPRLDVDAPSRTIDDGVKALVARGLSVYEVDAERLRRLSPDVILTQTQCEVCAVTPDDLAAALAEWTGARPRIVSLAPDTLDSVWASFEVVAEALGEPEAGARLRAASEARAGAIAKAARELLGDPPGVACIEWIDPLMTAGNWVPELVSLAGGQSVLAETGAHSGWLEPERLAGADPDLVIAMPCGFSLERTRREVEAARAEGDWLPARAIASGAVALTDGHHYFNRPGPRLVDSLAILVEILTAPVGDAALSRERAHYGSGWEWLGLPAAE